MKNYYIRLTFLTVVIAVIALILFNTVLKNFYLPVFWMLLLFFFILHIGSHTLILIAEKKQIIKFNTAYLLSFTVKFVSYIVFLIIYLVHYKRISLSFVIALFTLYIIFTVFEIRSNLAFSKSTEKNIEKSN